MRKQANTLLVVLLALADCHVLAFERGEAEFNFKVIDEKGAPVADALMHGGAWWPPKALETDTSKKLKTFRVTTDTNGCATARLAVYSDLNFVVKKEGFYETRETYDLGLSDLHKMTLDRQLERWKPWPAKKIVVLKHIRNPVPMYSKNVLTILPEQGKPIGYYLMKGDWVAPYGLGIISDLVINVTGVVSNIQTRFGPYRECDLQMRVTFSNKGDGIVTNSVPVHNEGYQGSLFVTDHETPADGYKNEYSFVKRKRFKREENINVEPRRSQIAYFRVRSERDGTGRLKRAYYGSMLGDLRADLESDGRVSVSFSYAINPDGTRNVERAKGVNLFR